VKSQAVLAEHLSAIWLTPQMDRLFLEGPGSRRRFLDRLVFNSDPAHLGRVNAYEHAMRERMALLRANGDKAWVETLEDTMATRGVAVAAARLEATRRLGEQLKESTGAFPRASVEAAGTVEDWLREGPALAAEDRLRAALAARRADDVAEGRAAIGPHRSDLKVLHLGNGRPAALCSTGEQKALLVALVLGTAKMRAYEQGTAPLLLLDEIAAHLDEIRLQALFDEISGLGAQVWLTGTDAGLFAPLAGRAQFFAVNDGTVTPQDSG
jgi:DNA replication and repair protein RecF